jgi:hypothetical protein
MRSSEKSNLVFQTTFLLVKTGYWGSIQPMLAQLKTMIAGYEKYD